MIEKLVSGGGKRAWIGQQFAEDGTLSVKYQLIETSTSEYSQRTIQNIIDSDGTLIFTTKPLSDISDGTRLTCEKVHELKKPWLLIHLLDPLVHTQKNIIEWIRQNNITILNVAGPRESQCPGIYQLTYSYLLSLLPQIKSPLAKL